MTTKHSLPSFVQVNLYKHDAKGEEATLVASTVLELADLEPDDEHLAYYSETQKSQEKRDAASSPFCDFVELWVPYDPTEKQEIDLLNKVSASQRAQ